MTDLGFIKEDEMAPFLARYFNMPFVNLSEIYKDINTDVIKLINEEMAYRFTLLPVAIEEDRLTVAMHDPLDIVAVDAIKIKTGMPIKKVMAHKKDIIKGIEYCYHHLSRLKEHVEDFIELETGKTVKENDSEKLRIFFFFFGTRMTEPESGQGRQPQVTNVSSARLPGSVANPPHPPTPSPALPLVAGEGEGG